ncbi:anoctamin-10 [Thalassophryne amazonica]|uniref:anoctamin-10 n=1 Tax=Thalassophryne amazonica TaxID=390379 RepID=UPI00147124E8|nr:anoctamin-10 [Thalassophryne amazonica]XP_034033120.1 anoctamin-10 [Thalassophryne amazonica]XP_034033121.1 anoctamin-10 [Thalassophryne amazonica]
MSKVGVDRDSDGVGTTGPSRLTETCPDQDPKLLSKLNVGSIGQGWTKVNCPCCVSKQVEPLVLVKLGEWVRPETKRWLMRLIGASQKDGGAALLAHPGENATGDVIVVSAPRCTLLRAAEELGLCKMYRNGDMEAFHYDDRDNFKDSDNMEALLTLAERQFIVKYELEGLRAQKDLRIPGLPDEAMLHHRDNIWQKLVKGGMIVDMFPLHNPDKLAALSKAWYSGNHLVQPLDSINEYFGSSIGFYFSFLDFYTWSLLPPAILGLIITYFSGEVQKEMMQSFSSSQATGGDDDDAGLTISGYMIQAVFSMIWSTIIMEMWKRRSSSLSYRWGTLYLAERFAEPRPSFHGKLGVNPVTGRMEPLFSEWERDLRVALVSLPVVGLFLGLVLLGMLGFYWGETQVRHLHKDWDSLLSEMLLYMPSILHIAYTNILATVYCMVAQTLTEFENHREESAFQNHLTAKVLVFTFFNYFAVLFHIAFCKQDMPLLRKRLASLLIMSQLVNQVTEVVIPFLVDRLVSAPHRKETEHDPQEDKFRNQFLLPTFPGLFAEYIELLVQFGYLSLFSCVYPLTAVLLLINNLTEIRSDAYKICKLFRKPFCPPVANMGVWQVAFEVLSFVSVISNCWLLLLSPLLHEQVQEGGVSPTNTLLLAVLIEHLLILVKVLLAVLIPDEPDWIRKKMEHIEFMSMQALRQQKVLPEES